MFETLIQKLQEDRFLTLETTPQHEPSMHNIIERIKKFKLQDRVDGFSCTDNPLAKLKYNALFASLKLQMEFKKPVIATMSMRDRNKIALQSDLMGANDFDVRAILALTGDYNDLRLRRTLQNSYMLSSDVSAAFDPNYPSVMEKKNCAYFGKGLVLNKYTGARGKSGSNDANPEYIAQLRKIFDEAKVALKTTAKTKMLINKLETFTIALNNLDNNFAHLEISWEKTIVPVKIEVPTDKIAMASIDKALNGPVAADYYAAGTYYFQSNGDMKKALEYVDKALNMNAQKPFWQLRQKSLIQAKLGDKKGAIETAKLSLTAAEAAKNSDYVKMNKDSIAEWSKK